MPRTEYNQMRHRKRRGCNEDCLKRIATYLCQLEHDSNDKVVQELNNDGCCAGTFALEETLSRGRNSEASEIKVPTCADTCCGVPVESPLTTATPSLTTSGRADVCCGAAQPGSVATESKAQPETGCCSASGATEDSCCTVQKSHSLVAFTSAISEPSCCSRGKSCEQKGAIVNAQLGEQEAASATSSTSSLGCKDECCFVSSDETSDPPISTCNEHLQAAFDRYEALVRLGQCLCRTVKEKFGICCCAPASRTLCHTTLVTPRASAESKPSKRAGTVEKGMDEKVTRAIMNSAPDKVIQDVEDEAAREHVVVGISGMTCTGCSRKMMNVLDHTPGLSSAKVTFVTESAEFDLDTKIANVEQTIQRVEKETGFKLVRVGQGKQELFVLLQDMSPEDYARAFPNNLVTIEKYHKKIYKVTYDPHLIGARSLMLPEVQLAQHESSSKVRDGQRRLMGTAALFASAMILTIPVVVLNWGHFDVSQSTVDIVSIVLATLVQAIAIPESYIGAVKSLVYSRVIEMDMLVVMSITIAYLYSIIAFILQLCYVKLEQGPFFETAALLITLILLGRLLSAYARIRAVSAVTMSGLQSCTAALLQADGTTQQIDARLLEFGDNFRVAPHTRIVTDGMVIAGESAIDESMITGEAIPVPKNVGDKVIAGTLNGSSELDCRLTRLPGKNSISDIAALVEAAVEAKPRVQDLADMIASYFIPCVMLIALIVFSTWVAIAVKVRGENGGGAVGTAFTYAIAVLAVSCPCALGLAVPMVLIIAGGVAAKAGVVIKAALAVERGHRATDVVFDKTGTLTLGDLQVVAEEYIPNSLTRGVVNNLAKSLVDGETHPVSVALASHFANIQTSHSISLQAKRSRPGLGIEAEYEGQTVRAGNPFWLGIEDHAIVRHFLNEGLTLCCITVDGTLVLAVGLRSSLRPECVKVISKLRSRKIDCHIVSGDHVLAVEQVGRSLGISNSNIAARSSPADKQRYVERLQQRGKKVIFVGDGTNDAVAIAQANVGVKMGTASDVTTAVADVVLTGGLNGVIQFLDVSKRAFNRIWFNFAWSAVYNTFAILLAAGAFVKVRIPPAYAGLGEIVSILPVILAALSLSMSTRW